MIYFAFVHTHLLYGIEIYSFIIHLLHYFLVLFYGTDSGLSCSPLSLFLGSEVVVRCATPWSRPIPVAVFFDVRLLAATRFAGLVISVLHCIKY